MKPIKEEPLNARSWILQNKRGFIATPHDLPRVLMGVLNHMECAVLLNIASDTVGRYSPNKLVEIRGDEWAEIRIKDLAKICQCSREWIGKIVGRLVECKAIEQEQNPKDKRSRVFRCLPWNFEKVIPAEVKRLRPLWDAQKAPTPLDEPEPVPVPGDECDHPHPEQLRLMFVVGGRRVSIDDAGLCQSCVTKLEHLGDAPAPEANQKANKGRKIGELQFTHLAEVLNADLAALLGPVPPKTVTDLLALVHDAEGMELLRQKYYARIGMFRSAKRAWGGVVHLARELAESRTLAESVTKRDVDAAAVAAQSAATQAINEARDYLRSPKCSSDDRLFYLRLFPALAKEGL